MKRILAVLMAALITASLAACGSTEEETSNKSLSSESVSSDENSDKESSETSDSSNSSESSESSENSEVALSELSMPEKAGELLKKGLKTFLTELDNDKYRLDIHMSSSQTDPKVVIITRSGDSITAATGDSEENLSKSVVKDNKGYVIDDEAKTVTWADFDSGYAEGYTKYLATLFYVTNIEPSKTGKEKYGDENKEMDFEEYKVILEESSTASDASSETSEIEEQYLRYYFDNGTFAGMKVMNGEDYYSLQIVSLTHEIPKDEFDIPSDYKLVEAEESSEEASSTASDVESTASQS